MAQHLQSLNKFLKTFIVFISVRVTVETNGRLELGNEESLIKGLFTKCDQSSETQKDIMEFLGLFHL